MVIIFSLLLVSLVFMFGYMTYGVFSIGNRNDEYVEGYERGYKDAQNDGKSFIDQIDETGE